ncbi:hypothetical protein RHMOL_Rhmol03G0092200 [Rhododendron molle]|uniref:Uncharacterized protein n=1 Tax=Rhododendron molle TaxID=49168 RepID=A0ACC0PDG8_RHOML|nr:hypothetical protein RHMOL_Rhmol03G0092200 [Rhododendron molle]
MTMSGADIPETQSTCNDYMFDKEREGDIRCGSKGVFCNGTAEHCDLAGLPTLQLGLSNRWRDAMRIMEFHI